MQKQQQHLEFIIMMAALMSSMAFALDALLPALDLIGSTLGNLDPAKNQKLVTIYFLGAGSGPLLFGPLSDSVGRKPLVYFGFGLFLLASWICVSSASMGAMIVGRFLQGVALSAPRTISIAMIRDKFSGDYMARITSFVTAVFILVPVIAPSVGKAILDAFGWKAIFYFQMGFGVLVAVWFAIRQPETLSRERRNTFRPVVIFTGFREVVQYRTTVLYTGIWGLITGSFLVYLSTSQQIFENQYGAKDLFPYLFAALAVTIGSATLLNGTLVLRLGMRKLIGFALWGYIAVALVYSLIYYGQANPPIPVLMVFLCLQFFVVGFLFGNLRAMAMEPLGHIAGLGAAITLFMATALSVTISTWIGSFVHHTAYPMFLGFLGCGVLALALFAASQYQSRPYRG